MKTIYQWGERAPSDHTAHNLPLIELREHEGKANLIMRDATGFVVGVDLDVPGRIGLARALIGAPKLASLPAAERVAYAQTLLDGTDYHAIPRNPDHV